MIADLKVEGYKIIADGPYIDVKFEQNPEDWAADGETISQSILSTAFANLMSATEMLLHFTSDLNSS